MEYAGGEGEAIEKRGGKDREVRMKGTKRIKGK